MSNFKVGDMCVIVACSNHPEFVGKECTIIGHFIADWWITDLPLESDKFSYWNEVNLRLKRPPNKDEPRADFTPGEWDLCPWQPNLTTKEHP